MGSKILFASLIVSAAASTASADLQTSPGERRFQFRYAVVVTDIPVDATTVKVWIPIPQSDTFQTIENVAVDTPAEWSFVDEQVYGNRFVYIEIDARDPELAIDITFNVTRRAATALPTATLDPADRAQYLAESALIKFDGKVGEEALRVAGDRHTPIDRARALYDNIVATVTYDKSGDGWGRGDSYYACDARRGNCTDFHSLFIAQARRLGIPARFIMGFPLPPDTNEGTITGYHCWAEFWIAGTGWIPIDASEAFKHPEQSDFYFGALDPSRVQFTRGRDLHLPGSALSPVNYSVYPHVEIDGTLHETVEHRFYFTESE